MFHLLTAAAAMVTFACGGGGGGSSDKSGASDLALVDVSVGQTDGVATNEIITLEFTEALDPDSVRADTIQIREGPNFGKQVAGFYEVDGNKVRFYPRLPTLADLSDSGFQPGKDYRIILPGIPKVATVRNFEGDRLRKATTVNFKTALPGSAAVFTDNFLDPLPSKVLAMNPPDGAVDVPAESTITLTLNRRPLHPATVTPVNITLTMIERQGMPVNRPIQGTPVLVQSHDAVSIVYQPTFDLADDATYRLEVDRRVQDLTGNDIVPFSSTFTIRDEPFRFSELVFEFNETELEKPTVMDIETTTASWNEPAGPENEPSGVLSALFTIAGGNGTAGDLIATTNREIRPTSYPRGVDVVTEDGVEYEVYNFRTVRIPKGVVVRFSPRSGGPNRPVKILALKTIEIDGTITVAGDAGDDSEAASYDSALPLRKGGEAGPGGTDGADTLTSTTNSTSVSSDADDVPYGGEGGEGGHMSGYQYYSWSGGGGGGGSRTDGADGTQSTYPTSTYKGAAGAGGRSAVSRGYPLNVERRPNVGGAGGGAGGNGFYYYNPIHTSGGAGGGGGGAITIQSAGNIELGPEGKILASGGAGGAMIASTSSYQPGAGGGGAGGSILLKATGELDFTPGSVLDVAGGAGGLYMGTYTYYKAGEGGAGGDGYLRLEAREDENSPGKPVINGLNSVTATYGPIPTGVYAPMGGGAPSIGQTVWMNLGVFDPVMIKPSPEDRTATLYNDSMTIEVQMATEDPNNLGNPNLDGLDITDADGDGAFDDTLDPTTLSEWTKVENIESLNGKGYQFIRIRIVFQLDPNQTVDLPLPFLDRMVLKFKF